MKASYRGISNLISVIERMFETSSSKALYKVVQLSQYVIKFVFVFQSPAVHVICHFMFVRVYAVVRFSDENGFYGVCLLIYYFLLLLGSTTVTIK